MPHEAWFQVAGYFFYYGHYYAARCIEQLKGPEANTYRDQLAGLLLGLQEKDGSWWDFPFYAYHQPYGTAFALMSLTRGAWAAGMETVKIAPDKKGCILHPSGDRYIPWGHNYASVDIMDRLAKDPARVEREFLEMKAAGTTVARIHPEMPRILAGADKADPNALDQLRKLLRIAENSGIHLKITGLACYKIKDRMAWYDSRDEQDRWKTASSRS